MSSQNLTITDSPRKRYRLFKKKPAGAGWGCQNDVRFTPNNGHSEGSRKESVNDPKRTFVGLRHSVVWSEVHYAERLAPKPASVLIVRKIPVVQSSRP